MNTNDTRTPEEPGSPSAVPGPTDSGTPAVDMLQEVYEEPTANQPVSPDSIIAKLGVYLGKPSGTPG